jgi:hypothetical protein
MFAGYGSAERNILAALQIRGGPLAVADVAAMFPKSFPQAIRLAAYSLAEKGGVRLSGKHPMLIYSASACSERFPREANSTPRMSGGAKRSSNRRGLFKRSSNRRGLFKRENTKPCNGY